MPPAHDAFPAPRNAWDPEARTLADFPNWAITRKTTSGGAVLDAGFFAGPGVPDFAPSGYGTCFATTSHRCAQAIRANAAGTDGKNRTSPSLRGYDLTYQLMPHWHRKMLFHALGHDPNDVIASIRNDDVWSLWPVVGSWLDRVRATKHLEFFFRLLLAHRDAILAKTPTDIPTLHADVTTALRAEINAIPGVGWSYALGTLLDQRLGQAQMATT